MRSASPARLGRHPSYEATLASAVPKSDHRAGMPLPLVALVPLLVPLVQDGGRQDGVSVAEPGGGRLVGRGAELVRRRGGEESVVGEPFDGPAGQIRDLALDPAGLVFVAAERGLLVLSPEVDALDAVELGPGAPPGTPTSVHVDAQRRVWIATEEAVGVIDPSFFWGRTLTAADGIPAAGPYRLAADGRGGLRIETPEARTTYRPDAGVAPRLVGLLVDGVPRTHGDELALEHDVALALAAEGAAAGGATFLWRLDGHHVWQPFDGATEVAGPKPGRHLLEVVAVDRDLRRSAPLGLTLDVGYPELYGKRFVTSVTGAALLVLLVGFLIRYRGTPGRAIVSCGMAMVILLQLVAALTGHARGWPFVGYTMYTQTYARGDVVYDAGLFGITIKGRLRRISEHAAGAAIDSRWQVLRPLIDGGDEAAREFLAARAQRSPKLELVGLQVRAERTRLLPGGPVQVAPLILSSYREDGAEEDR